MVTSLRAGLGAAGRVVARAAKEKGSVERGPVEEGFRTWFLGGGQLLRINP